MPSRKKDCPSLEMLQGQLAEAVVYCLKKVPWLPPDEQARAILRLAKAHQILRLAEARSLPLSLRGRR